MPFGLVRLNLNWYSSNLWGTMPPGPPGLDSLSYSSFFSGGDWRFGSKCLGFTKCQCNIFTSYFASFPSPTVHNNCYYPKNKYERNKMTLQTATPPCIKASFNMLQSQSGLAAEQWWQPLALKDSQNLPCVTNPTYSTLIALWYSSNEYSPTQEQSANKSFIEGLLLFHISQQTISTSKKWILRIEGYLLS